MNTANIRGFQHVGLPVKDMDATIRFYEGIGFHVSHRSELGGTLFVFLELGSCCIEGWQAEETAGCAGAIDHLCLDVVNIDEVYKDVVAMGHQVITNGVEQAPFWEKGVRYFKILGPDAEIVEFCEILK